MLEILALSPTQAALLGAICFVAGLVRGFSGFGLSALVMVSASSFVAPIALIPMLWWLEMGSSLVMMKGGFSDGDRRIGFGLTICAALGLPIGLWLTLSLPVETSRILALGIILLLAATQLGKLRIPALATTSGVIGAGLTAGVVTGLASAGGMVVALYVLAQSLPARVIRGSLSIYLLGAGSLGIGIHLILGTMTPEASLRGVVLLPITLLGLFAGRALFIPRFERLYKPVCLVLLIALSFVGLMREALI